MAGFFSLSGGGNRGNNNNNPEEEQQRITAEISQPDCLFWHRNEDGVPYNRGFELWQQQQQQQQQQHLQQRQFLHQQDLYSSAAALGVGPSESSVNVPDVSEHLLSSRSAYMMMRSSSSSGGISCQDCGNQAKKDCVHMRCRTCCKSRGLDCQTHVKSTWVPIAKRRERQQQLQHGGENPKQRRENASKDNPRSSSLACAHLPQNPSGSGLVELGSFPAEVNSAAVFRCVKVTSIDDTDDQYAYQTAVNIGGHLFRGILYDQGPETDYMAPQESSSATLGGAIGGRVQPLNLTATAADPNSSTGEYGGAAVVSSSGVMVDPSSLYPAPFSSFIAGTQIFQQPRSRMI